ncbi:MAG: hypothetical protein AAGG53_02435 [Cyanobacteria bacterium P01_H01_bin.152]
MKRRPPKVTQQAERIIAELHGGTHWSQIGGRKLHHSLLVVFNLYEWYRLICWFDNGTLVRQKVLSHQDYNSYASNTRR